jgi:hypothetical protein
MARFANMLSCRSGRGAKLFFPPGTYIISDKLLLSQDSDFWHSVTIEGGGAAGTVIEAVHNSGVFDLRFSKQVAVTVRDLTLVAETAHAGAAVSISMAGLVHSGAPRSLVMQDVSIMGKEIGVNYFDFGLKGSGLTNPLIDGVKVVGPAFPRSGGQFTYGNACVSLVGGWGAEIVNPSSCNVMTVGLDLKQFGGLVSVHARNFGVGTNYGIRIDAGGGGVVIEDTHVNTAVMGIEINNATSVTVADNLLLAVDATSASGHGGVSIDNSSNVSVRDNILWRNAAVTNPNRTGINIGPGDSNVAVEGNTINDLGTGIAIAGGVSASRILYNRFSGPARNVVDSGTRTVVRQLQPESETQSQ